MNRVNLRLYSPPEEPVSSAEADEHETDIIPFETARRSLIFSGRFMPAVDRARVIRNNSTCPSCEGHCIELLELDDALISPKSRLPVPGTATIVGFHCSDCGAEWPVYELTRRNG